MNRFVMSLLPLAAVACAGAQVPAPANTVSASSRVARYLPGPGDRPQGALLRNGTFVTFSPGLAQRLPASLSKNASVQVVGEGFSYAGSRAIQARTVTIAGVSYTDDAPVAEGPPLNGRPGPEVGPNGAPAPPPPLPPDVPPPPPPAGRVGPPPPPPPPLGVAPAGLPGAAAPLPPPHDGVAPPPPPVAGTPAAPPAPAVPSVSPSGR